MKMDFIDRLRVLPLLLVWAAYEFFPVWLFYGLFFWVWLYFAPWWP